VQSNQNRPMSHRPDVGGSTHFIIRSGGKIRKLLNVKATVPVVTTALCGDRLFFQQQIFEIPQNINNETNFSTF
jgi:hypothetical protein